LAVRVPSAVAGISHATIAFPGQKRRDRQTQHSSLHHFLRPAFNKLHTYEHACILDLTSILVFLELTLIKTTFATTLRDPPDTILA
jgi:hypothetical protein